MGTSGALTAIRLNLNSLTTYLYSYISPDNIKY